MGPIEISRTSSFKILAAGRFVFYDAIQNLEKTPFLE